MSNWLDFMQTVIDGDTYFSADEWAKFKQYLSACCLLEQQLATLQETANTAIEAWNERLGFYKREVQRLEWELAAKDAEIARLHAAIPDGRAP